jgi:hypothetical protein
MLKVYGRANSINVHSFQRRAKLRDSRRFVHRSLHLSSSKITLFTQFINARLGSRVNGARRLQLR